MKERKRGGGGQEKRVEGQREGPPPAIGSIAAGRWGGGEGGWPQSLRCFEASPPGSPGESDTGVEPV